MHWEEAEAPASSPASPENASCGQQQGKKGAQVAKHQAARGAAEFGERKTEWRRFWAS